MMLLPTCQLMIPPKSRRAPGGAGPTKRRRTGGRRRDLSGNGLPCRRMTAGAGRSPSGPERRANPRGGPRRDSRPMKAPPRWSCRKSWRRNSSGWRAWIRRRPPWRWKIPRTGRQRASVWSSTARNWRMIMRGWCSCGGSGRTSVPSCAKNVPGRPYRSGSGSSWRSCGASIPISMPCWPVMIWPRRCGSAGMSAAGSRPSPMPRPRRSWRSTAAAAIPTRWGVC